MWAVTRESVPIALLDVLQQRAKQLNVHSPLWLTSSQSKHFFNISCYPNSGISVPLMTSWFTNPIPISFYLVPEPIRKEITLAFTFDS